MVGLVNTVVTLGVIFVCMKLFKINYIYSNAIGYIAGVINSYVLNRLWTFNSSNSVVKEFIRFILVFIICYGVQLVVLLLMTELLDLQVELSQVIAIFVYTLINFLANKYFVYTE
jgi:putative flippase GtrA